MVYHWVKRQYYKCMDNLFGTKKTIPQKVENVSQQVKKASQHKLSDVSHQIDKAAHQLEESVTFKNRQNKYQKHLHLLQQAFIYVAVFLAGYIVAIVQTLTK